MELNIPEPLPTINKNPPVWDFVYDDALSLGLRAETLQIMKDRDNFGRKKYGITLQPFNGRNPKIDLIQELLDAAVYCKQILLEQPNLICSHYGRFYFMLLVDINRFVIETEDQCPK